MLVVSKTCEDSACFTTVHNVGILQPVPCPNYPPAKKKDTIFSFEDILRYINLYK